MPIFIAALIGGLVQAAGSLVGRVLIAMGVGFVTYQGINTAMSYILSHVFSNLDALSPTIVGMLGTLNVGKAINVIFSAISARLVLNGLGSGTVKRMVFK
jgi:hypothetical protein